MVEYRWDPASDRAVLMEINGRYWGSYPLAVHCHADFALISYFLESGLDLPSLPPPRDDIRCRMVATEIKRLARILLKPGLIVDQSFEIRPWAEARRFMVDFFGPECAITFGTAVTQGPFLPTCATSRESCCRDDCRADRHAVVAAPSQGRSRFVAMRPANLNRVRSQGVKRGIWNRSVALRAAPQWVLTAASNPSSRATATLSTW